MITVIRTFVIITSLLLGSISGSALSEETPEIYVVTISHDTGMNTEKAAERTAMLKNRIQKLASKNKETIVFYEYAEPAMAEGPEILIKASEHLIEQIRNLKDFGDARMKPSDDMRPVTE